MLVGEDVKNNRKSTCIEIKLVYNIIVKIKDIPDKYFDYLVNHSRGNKETCEDLKGFFGIDVTRETNIVFPTESELLEMKASNIELTTKQWLDFWKIIEETEIGLAKARVFSAQYEAECRDLNEKHPFKYDKEGYAYREFVDWEGQYYREYQP